MAARRVRSRYEQRGRVVSVVMASVLLLSLVGGALATIAQGSGDDPTPTTRAAVVDAEGQELLDLAAASAAATFHATYELRTGDPEVVTIDLVRADGGFRELIGVGGEQRLRANHGETVGECVRPAGGEWTCRPDDPAGTDSLLASVRRSELLGVDVTEVDQTIEGRAVRCFSWPSAQGVLLACLTPDGVPVRLSARGDSVELVSLGPTVPAGAFDLPAPIVVAVTTTLPPSTAPSGT